MTDVRTTDIIVEYCPRLDERASVDNDCFECDYYSGLNSDGEVLCEYAIGGNES